MAYLLPQHYHFDLLRAIARGFGAIGSMYRAELFMESFRSAHAMMMALFPLNNKKARDLKRTEKKNSTSTWTSARAQGWEQMESFNVKAVLIRGCNTSLGGRLDSSAWSWARVTVCAGVLHVLCMSMWVSSFFPHPSSSKQVDCLQEIAPWSASCPG